MINCDDVGVRVVGSTLNIIQDFTNIVSAVRKALLDNMTPETADELIALCGQLAYASAAEDKSAEADLYERITKTLIDNAKS